MAGPLVVPPPPPGGPLPTQKTSEIIGTLRPTKVAQAQMPILDCCYSAKKSSNSNSTSPKLQSPPSTSTTLASFASPHALTTPSYYITPKKASKLKSSSPKNTALILPASRTILPPLSTPAPKKTTASVTSPLTTMHSYAIFGDTLNP